uniref:Uncharacterized protein n=1 Tax=Rhizophora mucronata TaxID=61149 RepID=A0A2P2R0E5_RHIMU
MNLKNFLFVSLTDCNYLNVCTLVKVSMAAVGSIFQGVLCEFRAILIFQSGSFQSAVLL